LTGDQPVPRAKLAPLPATEPLALLSSGLDEPLLLMTSGWRLLLVTMRDLLHQRAAGLTLAELYGFDRGEQICQLRRWAPLRVHEQLILASTQGYARRFEMAQLRPLIEGPTPTRIDWSLPGWPRLALGADDGQDVALVTATGRALRVSAQLVRRTGTRVLHKQKSDEIIGGQAVTATDWLCLLASEGWAKWLCAAHIPAGTGGEQGTPVVRRRGALCGLLAEGEAPVRLLTTMRLIPVDPHSIPREDSLSMHRVVKLGKDEQVLGIVQ
jgi:DNA gyrase/topoisomerase IV subunit A